MSKFLPFTSGEEHYIFRQAKWDNDSSKQWKGKWRESQMGRKVRWKEIKGGVCGAERRGKKRFPVHIFLMLSPIVTASNDNPAFRSWWKHWFNILSPRVAVILKLLSGYIQTGGGKMMVATSNANAPGVITDTASFPILLFFPACPAFFLNLFDVDQLHHLLAYTTFTPKALALHATQGLLLTLN